MRPPNRMSHSLTMALAALSVSTQAAPIPRRMDSDTTPRHICESHDVFFNGIRQLCCKVADVDQGYIVRYKKSVGRRPVGTATEVLRGKVEIRRKSEAGQTRGNDDTTARGAAGVPPEEDPGAGTRVPCSATDVEKPTP
jgi:hypothetical protein